MIRKILSQSALVGLFGIIGGGFNYLYLASAIKKLDILLLAELNTYLSWFQISLCIPALIQSFVVISAPALKRVKRIYKVQLLVSFFALIFFVNLFYYKNFYSEYNSIKVILFLSFLLYCFFNFWLGVFQSQKLFLVFSILGIFVAFFKYLGTFFVYNVLGYVSVIFVSIFCASFLVFVFRKFLMLNNNVNSEQAHLAPKKIKLDIFCAFFLGLLIVLLPNYDVLILRYLVGLESAGEYSRIQIFTKIIFFAPMILLQITLPYYVSEFKLKLPQTQLKNIRKVEVLGFIGSLLLCVFFGLLGPHIFNKIFNFKNYNFTLIFMGCLSILPSYLFMSSMQIFAAAKNVWGVLYVFLSLGLLPIFTYIFSISSIYQYLQLAVILQFTLAAFIFFMTQRALR